MKELNTFRKFLNEGTWSYGSENQMIKALEEMNAMMMHSDPRQFKAGLEAMDNALYRIFGDDNFHDEFSNAKSYAAEGDLDRAKNALGDAMGIGDRMIRDIHGMEGDLEENKEETNEIFGMGKKINISNTSKRGEMVLDFSAFVEELMDEGVINPKLHQKLSSGIAELYTNVMDAEPGEVQKTYDYEPFEDDGLEENDAALDEVINEAKPNLKKALPKIAARNVERNNNINFDIESMMDMVGEAGKGEDSKEAKILFKASNASDELEQALVDLQIYFEDDLDEGKKEE